MKIAVLVKHTADVRGVRIDTATGEPHFEGKPGLDRADQHAISAGIDLKESCDGHVTVIGLGPEIMKDDLVNALATGADEAIHMVNEADSDTLGIAQALARELSSLDFDVIIVGKLSEDYGTGQVGMQLAELLDIPHLSSVMSAVEEGGSLRVSYDLDGFPDEVTLPTPILLVMKAGEGEATRHPSLRGMMTARRKTIDTRVVGTERSHGLSWTAPMAARRSGERIIVREDDPTVAARKLADWLKENRLVG